MACRSALGTLKQMCGLGYPVLRQLAVKLTERIRQSSSIDWQRRGDARAKMRMMVKVMLKTCRYRRTPSARHWSA